MKSITLIAIALAILVLTIAVSPVAAATLNITDYGAVPDDGSGDLSSINNAISAASAGDTVYFPAGTFNIAGSVQGKNGVTLEGAAGSVLLYDGSASECMISLYNRSNVTITGLTLDGNNSGTVRQGIAAGSGSGLDINHVTIRNIGNAEPHGIRFDPDVTDSKIAYCTISNIGTGSAWGAGLRISWRSSRNVIENNTISNTGRGGILCNDDSTDLIIRNNTVTGSGMTAEGLGIELWGRCHRSVVENNTIDHWLSLDSSEYCAVRNNIVSSSSGYSLCGLEGITANCVFADNTVDGGQHIGMSLSGAYPKQYILWARNNINKCGTFAVQLAGEGGGANYQYFYKNKFTGTLPGGLWGNKGDAVHFHGNASYVTFEDNEISGNANDGISLFDPGTGPMNYESFTGNTIINNGNGAVWGGFGPDLEWSGNTIYGNRGGVYGDDWNHDLPSTGFSNQKPTASFDCPDTVQPGATVAFANTSTDADGTIAYALWDFGDGIPSTEISPSHAYAHAGSYVVTLVVWDNGGRGKLFSKTINVAASPAPVPTSITPASGPDSGWMDISDIAGQDFAAGASVRLVRSGQADIVGTRVNVISPTRITCRFDLMGRALGPWDLVVSNPDRQSGRLVDAFTIVKGTPISVTINQALSQPDPTNASTIAFSAVFSDSVSGFTDGDVVISGTCGGTLAAKVTGSGTTYTVTVSGMSGNGTVVATIPQNVAHNASGTANAASTSTDNTVTYDQTGPAIDIGSPSSARANTGPVTFTVKFTDAANVAMTADEVILNKTGTADGTVEVSGDGVEERIVTIRDISGDGELAISLDAGIALDSIGNQSSAAGPSGTVVIDNSGPQTVITGPDIALTRHGPVAFTVTYSDAAAISLSPADITLNTPGTAAGTVTVTGTDSGFRTVVISDITGDGPLSISLVAGTATDDLGNPAVAAGPSNEVLVDNTGPIATVDGPDPMRSNRGPVRFLLSFADAASLAMTDSDVTVEASGTATAVASVSGTGFVQRTILLSSIAGSGTLNILVAPGVAVDAAGNPSTAVRAAQPAIIDIAGPVVTISEPSVTSTTVGPVLYTLSFADAARINLAASDVLLNKTGTASGRVTLSGVGLFERTVVVSDITGSGSLGISIPARAAMDSIGNYSRAAGPSSTFSIDSEAPTLSVSGPSPNRTRSGPVTFTALYSGASTISLTAGDVVLNKTGTADGVVSVTGSGLTSRTVTVSGITGNGTLGVSIAAGTAEDTAGNQSDAYGPSATVNVDNVGPVISVLRPSTSDKFARNSSELVLSGTTSDASGIAGMSWYLAGGTPEPCIGKTAWSTNVIALADGENEVVLEAEDELGNSTTITVQPTFIRTGPGTAWYSTALVSIPVIPDQADPKKVVGFYGDYWLTYSPATSAYVGYPASATWFNPLESTPGRGFWAKFGAGSHTAVGTIPAQNVERVVRLERGWNIIGVPFISPVKWDAAQLQVEVSGVRKALKDSADVLGNYAWGWNSADKRYYLVADPSVAVGAAGFLQPWQAYWMKASSACSLVIPAP